MRQLITATENAQERIPDQTQAVQRGRGSKGIYGMFIAICLLSVGVIMGFISASIYAQYKRKIQNGVEIVGTALKTETRVRYYRGGKYTHPLTTFTYNAAGKEYTQVRVTMFHYNEGDKLKIMYQMDNPESCMLLEGRQSVKGQLLGAKIAIWISVAFLLAGGFLLARYLLF